MLPLFLQPVLFGQIVQLLHVKSNKFLHVSVNTISETERNASPVLLSDEMGRCAVCFMACRVTHSWAILTCRAHHACAAVAVCRASST